jgi:transcription elongation factor Elf1
MMMTGIEPMGLGTDRRTFECDQCGHEEEFACQILREAQEAIQIP